MSIGTEVLSAFTLDSVDPVFTLAWLSATGSLVDADLLGDVSSSHAASPAMTTAAVRHFITRFRARESVWRVALDRPHWRAESSILPMSSP
ncbi:MAG: hypothetical protein JHC61_02600 [Burkholderiaceae bacterium]|nr:hypothetical protein [Burkholderiaceae bacterium]